MYSKLLLTSTFLVASALAGGYGGDQTSYGDGSGSWGSGGGDGGSNNWGDWGQSGQVTATPAVPAPQLAPSAPPMSWQPGELCVQVVSVSDASGSLKYYPDNIQAAVGSVVQFQFHPKNHTITESSFANPCQPLASNLTSDTRPGLKSGFVPVTGMESTTPVYNVLINDTKPIWLYCGQGPHCQKGMSMVINQNMSDSVKTIEKYQEAAALLPMPSSPASVSAPPYGAPPPPATSVVVAPPPPPPSDTGIVGGLPPPSTPVAGVTTSPVVGPATFTGAASRQDVNLGGYGGLVVAGLVALL